MVTSNTSFYGSVAGYFIQTGGVQVVQNKLLLDGDYNYDQPTVNYSVAGGTLRAANIDVGSGSRFSFSGGTVYNSNLFTIQDNGQVNVGTVTNGGLGGLQILPGGATLSLNTGAEGSAPAVLRFRDSHEIPWSGTLQIRNWRSGLNHIFIGTNSLGLTPDQLNRLTFRYPDGSTADFPATIAPTGEVVPAVFQNLVFATTNGSITITDYIGPGGDVVIPSNIVGLPVTAIGNYAFSSCPGLTSVTIPNSVTTIGNGAFGFCTGLTNASLGDSITTIGDYAFLGCSMTDVVIPNTVTNIGYGAFESSST